MNEWKRLQHLIAVNDQVIDEFVALVYEDATTAKRLIRRAIEEPLLEKRLAYARELERLKPIGGFPSDPPKPGKVHPKKERRKNLLTCPTCGYLVVEVEACSGCGMMCCLDCFIKDHYQADIDAGCPHVEPPKPTEIM